MRSLVLLCFVMTLAHAAGAKLGENPAQITKRFGSNYTVDHVQAGDVYKYRLKTFSVDVTFTDGLSTCETYYSDHPLDAKGEPPKAIVQGVLHTNVPKAKWVEIVASYLGADYALRSEDRRYIATISYKTPQPPGVVWTMTVQLAKTPTPEQMATLPKATPQPTAEIPAMRAGQAVTVGGYFAAFTEADLDRIVEMSTHQDKEALLQMIMQKRALLLNGGNLVQITETHIFSGKVKFRPVGSTIELWAPIEAIHTN